MLTDKDIKTTPRVAHTIEDFEVGQRIRWITDDYSMKGHHDESGVVTIHADKLAIEYDEQGQCYVRLDWIAPERGVWLILEEAPEPEIDPVAVAYGALKNSLRRFDGHRPFDADQSSGLAAIADVVRDARSIVRFYDELEN